MRYAHIILGLPVPGPFDYAVPVAIRASIRPGCRVVVPFGSRTSVGYVVSLARSTRVDPVKEILSLIDEEPLIPQELLDLTHEVARYYWCSWGEALETALPLPLRSGVRFPGKDRARVPVLPQTDEQTTVSAEKPVLLTLPTFSQRWEYYLTEMRLRQAEGKSSILLMPDVAAAQLAVRLLTQQGIASAALYRGQPQEMRAWLDCASGQHRVIVGTRSAVFAPLPRLGMICMEEEENDSYKQDQVPHYHARTVALMRAGRCGCRLILGSCAPSLESYYAAQRARYQRSDAATAPSLPTRTQIIDLSRAGGGKQQGGLLLTKYLEDTLRTNLSRGKRALLFINRRGFATTAQCPACATIISCPRCSARLVFHFQTRSLVCPLCNHTQPAPSTCPRCSNATLRYSGYGTEKVESELNRTFPQARIVRLEEGGQDAAADAQIVIATSLIFRQHALFFDSARADQTPFSLVGILSIDAAIQRFDFRSAERVFQTIRQLEALCPAELVIQTLIPQHHCFRAIEQRDPQLFYRTELSQRRDLGYPPFKTFCALSIKGMNEERVRNAAAQLFGALKQSLAGTKISLVEPERFGISRLRTKYIARILLKYPSARTQGQAVKSLLHGWKRYGIIVTADVDPR